MTSDAADLVATVRRWETAGGTWRVVERSDQTIVLGLFSCDGGEEMERLVSSDPDLARFVDEAARERDRDPAGRARQARPRDELGRPLPYGSAGVEPVSEEPLPAEETIAFARTLLADGRPFSAHEVFEARWKSGPEEERELWQGLAQLCVGITHAERGNPAGARTLLLRAQGRLTRYAATGGPAYALDLAVLTTWMGARLASPSIDGWLTDQPL